MKAKKKEKEKEKQPHVRCAECRLGKPISTPFGDPPLVQCSHTLLARVANSARQCGNYLAKRKGT
jgi:hypothetical protein